jgi:hypothetical protein
MVIDDVLIAGERVADENGIAALGVECAVSLVRDLQWAEIDAGIEPQRIVRRKAHDQRMRMVRFARAVGEIERGAGLCHKYFPDRRFPASVAPPPRRSKGRK